MILSVVVSLAFSAISSVSALATPPVDKVVGGYVLFGDPAKLRLLAEKASSLPVNRVWLSFVRPDMYYVPGSNSLVGAGLNYNNTQADYGFAEIKKYTQQLQAGGVEVFLSMGGWDYNCWPYAYAKYSIDMYSHTSATYQSTIQKYGSGAFSNCNESNQYCYACEPPSNGNTPDSFTIFPEPGNSQVWKDAQAYVIANNNLGVTPVYHPELLGGAKYNGFTVPGDATWSKLGRDPYEDFVLLAKDLGLDGVDIDYEEFWHADMFKTDGSAAKDCSKGDCSLLQTVYKFTTIMQDMRLSVQKHYPSLKVSTAGSAAGAWPGSWWGGNLKGLSLQMVIAYPDLVSWLGSGPNAGGWNIMTYDLSNDSKVGCPPTNNAADCTLDGQVAYYMGFYTAAGIDASVGYEIGTPAYPPPIDAAHQMPLTNALAGAILSNTQPYYKNGFFWELFKPQGTSNDVPVNSLAQNLCKVVLGANTPRCAGSLPILGDDVLPGSSTNVPITTPPNRPPPGGKPDCVAPYNATQQYKTNDVASYGGYNYHAKYWVPLGTAPNAPGETGWAQDALCKAASGSSSTTTTTTTSATSKTSTTTTTVAQPSSSTTTTTTIAKSSSTTTTTTAPVSTTTAAGSDCYVAWDSTKSYPGGSLVSYNNVNYKNTWWENPGAAPGAANGDGGWVSQGACGGPQSSTTTTTTVPIKSSSTTTTTTVAKTSTTTTTIPVNSSSTTTTTTKVATTTAAAGGNTAGAACSTYGAWACSNSLICSYSATSTLVWVQVGSVSSC
ncbi:UNVERIFIED_CONTAM: hypothetical protein HDU68_006272 [Siphonaria sp. JEL0065]|nr:hypothetical protein HDU68_006272 [Siphonaria sp. JEL0065]